MDGTVIAYILALVLSFLSTVLIERKLIPVLKSKKMGQKILEIGPRWHKNKEGTPTMGGIGFIIPIVLIFAVIGSVLMILKGQFDKGALFTVAFAVLNGIIGFIDDKAKFSKGKNEGLTAKQKYLLQLIAAAVYIASMALGGCIDTSLYIPFVGIELELGIFYYIIAFILITGVVNSVNLTDGIDGLAASVTLAVSAFFSVASFALGAFSLSVLSAAAIGGCIGFLVYNFYPAKVFMGDTGSLFLGALVVGSAFMINNPLIIIVAGIVYIAEAASVMLQVGFYKLTHKRIFRMAPLHHHFEMGGWSEIKLVSVFTAVTLIAGVIAWFGLK